MDWTGCEIVETIPGKVSGVPLLRHSRVQADSVLDSYELGESVEEIAFSYDLPLHAVQQVIAFAQAHTVAPAVR